ncbi:MAG: dolichol-phosphate mannosyltransferase [Verrucomicrobia bacterium]|nr:MAG: dolichol-phosphate mannosyltransferase [Verrucomicrobiota bacterium]
MLSVVIPLFNEEDNVAPLCEEIALALAGQPHEIILVDDKSTDTTLRSIPSKPEIRVIEFSKNTGQSAAMYAGIHAAIGDILILMDGDRQNDPADIQKLLAELNKGYDLVCGYRASRKDTFSKRLTSRFANSIRSRFTRDGVRDTGCTLKVLRRECREALLPFNGMHRFIPALIKGMGYKITEMPVNHRPRVAGVSKYGFGNRALRATMDMFAVRWLLSRQVQIRVASAHSPSA